MTPQQGLRHASWRAISGTAGPYNSDAMAAMRAELEAASLPVPATFNGRMRAWLRHRLGSSKTNLNDLLAEWAADEGADPGTVGSFDPSE